MSASPEVRLSDLLRALRQKLFWATLIMILCLTAAVLYAFLSKPIYRADVLFAISQQDDLKSQMPDIFGGLQGLASFGGLGGADSAAKDEALALLTSRKFTSDFIQSENIVQTLFSDDWADMEVKPSINDAFKFFNKDVRKLGPVKNSGLYKLSIHWTNPEQASTWANDIIKKANITAKQQAIADSEKYINYLKKELAENDVVEIRQAIFRLIEQEIGEIALAKVKDDYLFRVIDPAVTAEADEFESPQRKFIVIAGFVIGIILIFGMCLITVVDPDLVLLKPRSS